ncbi:MAG: hypothetical protein ACYTG0_18740 [Planctomycetota bacterium]
MQTKVTNSNPALGFLTVVEDPQHGLFGGYLVLNLTGRPLEFHCTAPVKPNRAQQILYGPTLTPYLYGEQIGRVLLAKSTLEPRVVCTDREPVLSVRECVRVPIVLVLPPDAPPDSAASPGPERGALCDPVSGDAPARQWRLDSPHDGRDPASVVQWGPNRLALPDADSDERRKITDHLNGLSESFDLAEPFQRIREAIEEARRGSH